MTTLRSNTHHLISINVDSFHFYQFVTLLSVQCVSIIILLLLLIFITVEVIINLQILIDYL